MSRLQLKVTGIAHETTLIRRIELASTDGVPLPGFAAGAHISIDVPEVGVRKYSLVNALGEAGATNSPKAYVVGVRLDAEGGGGSRFMHGLKIGDTVTTEAPKNDFPLRPSTAPALLIGGGIGITPLITMAAELSAQGRPFHLVYAVRHREECAFLPALASLSQGAVEIHDDAACGRLLDIAGRFAALGADQHVYMCGPKPMLKAGIAASRRLGWSPDRLKFELFYSAAAPVVPVSAPAVARSADDPFEVEIRSSGQVFLVPSGKTILDVLVEAGVDPIHDCKRGECGICQVGVVSGVPDHRDVILSEVERAANKVMQICISRAKSPRLVLDL